MNKQLAIVALLLTACGDAVGQPDDDGVDEVGCGTTATDSTTSTTDSTSSSTTTSTTSTVTSTIGPGGGGGGDGGSGGADCGGFMQPPCDCSACIDDASAGLSPGSEACHILWLDAQQNTPAELACIETCPVSQDMSCFAACASDFGPALCSLWSCWQDRCPSCLPGGPLCP